MPSTAVLSTRDLTPEQRCRQVASVLACGVARHRHSGELAKVGQFSAPRDKDLELLSKTRLSVSQGLATTARDLECEVNDERET